MQFIKIKIKTKQSIRCLEQGAKPKEDVAECMSERERQWAHDRSERRVKMSTLRDIKTNNFDLGKCSWFKTGDIISFWPFYTSA